MDHSRRLHGSDQKGVSIVILELKSIREMTAVMFSKGKQLTFIQTIMHALSKNHPESCLLGNKSIVFDD